IFTKTSSEELLNKSLNLLYNKYKTCVKCGSKNIWKIKNNFIIKCNWKPCSYKINALKKTCFSKFKIEMTKILDMIAFWIHGMSFKNISLVTNVSSQCVTRFFRKFNNVLATNYHSVKKSIGGENIIVEIDESKFGRRKYHRGHKVDGVWVFGLVERTPERKILLFPVAKRDKTTLMTLLKKHVLKNTVIYSDCWKAYSSLNTEFAGHFTVNHTKEFVNKENNVHINTIEGNWSAIKITVPKRHRSINYINMYLIKFMIKRNEPGNVEDNLLKYLL
ncbi:hypothetical protein H312_02146, partial [Anncaliia algerae PRA339]